LLNSSSIAEDSSDFIELASCYFGHC